MDYAAKAASVGLDGHQCKTCDSEVGADQPIAYDVEGCYGDDGSQARARVMCWTCWEALKAVEVETWLKAANLAGLHGYRVMADDCMARAKAVAASMERAMKAA